MNAFSRLPAALRLSRRDLYAALPALALACEGMEFLLGEVQDSVEVAGLGAATGRNTHS